MTFVKPEIKEIYSTLKNNDELITYLKENEYLLTRSMLYDSYTVDQIGEMETAILADNTETLYNLAEVLYNNSDKIESDDVWSLASNLVAFDDVAGAFGLDKKTFSVEAYKQIIYTYKYCYVSSFFQNNKEIFLPEYDFNEIENTPILKTFLDAIMKEFDKLDCVIGKCLDYKDFDEIPYDMINYLTQLLGFERANFNAESDIEAKYREIVRNIIDIYRVKGTNFSFELLFKFLGYNIEINEFYFDRRYYYSTGNVNTSSTDNTNFLFYMATTAPSENKLENTNNEFVDFNDYTTQYNLNEFSELADTYGPEAVLGYSKVDKNNVEYTGKVYKYFKSNLIYYTISIDKTNPTEKQLAQINKILTFLTPAYIMKTTNVNVYTGSNSTSPSDNMIFFDDNRTLENTLEKLEKEVSTEEGYEAIREKIRELYPIMLDSELRDDTEEPKITNADLYIDSDNNITHDDTSKSSYINTINTTTFKPKIPFRVSGKICLNKYASNKYFDFITIKNDVKENNLAEDVTLTDLSIADYLKTRPLKYSASAVNTLTLLETATKNEDNLKALRNKYDCCLEIEKNSSLPDFIAPITLGKDNVEKMLLTKCVLIITSSKIGVYKFGAVPSCNSNYASSFDIKLIKTQKLYRSINKKINLNTDLKEEKASLDDLYNAAKAKVSTEALKYYYFNTSENYWYYPIKKAKLTTKIVTVDDKTKYLKVSNLLLPISDSQAAELCIPQIFKTDGKYGYNSGTCIYNSPEEYFSANNVKIYNNFSFYIDDLDDEYESDLFTFYLNPSNELVYSTLDEKLYRIHQNIYEELNDFFGKLVIEEDSAKLYEYDEDWYGYNEQDDFDNFIWYNNTHKISWPYLGYYNKIISRPIKELTDKEVTEEIKDSLINEIFHSTFDYFSSLDKTKILNLGNFDSAGVFLEAIKNEEIKQSVIDYISEKAQSKDVYGNYNDNFGLLSEFLSSENYEEFVKWYYYNKLVKLYREAYIEEAGDKIFKSIFDEERRPLYETLNGNMGLLRKPNTLLQSRKGLSSLNVKYTVFSDNSLLVSKDELLKAKLLVFINDTAYLKDIKNIKLVYGTSSTFIYELDTSLDEDNNLIISCELPENVKDGYLEINNTTQLLSDNKINAHTSKFTKEEEFLTFGDDRKLDISGAVDEECEVITEDDELLILLENKDFSLSDAYSVIVEFTEDKKEVQFDNIKVYALVKLSSLEVGRFTALNLTNVKVDFTAEMSNLQVAEK